MSSSTSELVQLDETLWELPATRADMRVPARIFADRELIEALASSRALEQLQNAAALPGIVEAALAMPDMGNVHDPAGQSTWCPACGGLLIERDGYRLGRWNLTCDGRCGDCGTAVAGVFDGRRSGAQPAGSPSAATARSN